MWEYNSDLQKGWRKERPKSKREDTKIDNKKERDEGMESVAIGKRE